MTGVDIFILFVLPGLILVGALGGLWILNRPKPAKESVNVNFDYSNVLRHPAVNE